MACPKIAHAVKLQKPGVYFDRLPNFASKKIRSDFGSAQYRGLRTDHSERSSRAERAGAAEEMPGDVRGWTVAPERFGRAARMWQRAAQSGLMGTAGFHERGPL